MDITINIPSQRIADLMTTAIECANDTWCKAVLLMEPVRGSSYPEYTDSMGHKSKLWYCDPALYDNGFVLHIIETVEGDGEEDVIHIKNKDDVVKALVALANKHPNDFGDFMTENEDGITADLFLQYLTFGEVVYG